MEVLTVEMICLPGRLFSVPINMSSAVQYRSGNGPFKIQTFITYLSYLKIIYPKYGTR